MSHLQPQHKVFPDITRFPGERRLEGPPQKASESVFSHSGAVDAAGVLVDFADANSAQRRSLAAQIIAGRSSEEAQSLVRGLQYLIDPELNQSDESVKAGELALEALARHGLIPEIPNDLWESNSHISDVEAEFIGQDVSWMKLANEVTECTMLSPEKQKIFFKQKAGEMLKDPWDLEYTMITLMMSAPAQEDSPFMRDVLNYGHNLRQQIMEQAGGDKFSMPEKEEMYGWLCLHRGIHDDNPPHQSFVQEVAEKHLSRMVLRAHDPNTAIDAVHAILVGGLTSDNDDIATHALRISMGQTDILPVDSTQYYDFLLGYAVSTGESRVKAREIQAVRAKYEHFLDVPMREYLSSVFKVRFSDPYLEHQDRRINEFKEKYGKNSKEVQQALSDVSHLGASLSSLDAWRRGIMPKRRLGRGNGKANVIADAEGPLVDFLEERALLREGRRGYKYNPRKQLAIVAFPGSSEYVRSPHSEILEHIKTKIHEPYDGDEMLDTRPYWNTLSYLLPEGTSRGHLDKLDSVNQNLAAAMIDDPIHTLSPRGDKIEVVDPTLTGLGFESVTYKMAAKDKSNIDVFIQVGNLTYRARLNSNFELMTKDGHDLALPEAGIFVESVVLSHLHEIICTDNVGETSENGDVVEQRKAFSSRRAHRRVLEPGKKPTPKQVLKIMKEYGIDLPQKNQERLERGEESLITWVSEVDGIVLGGSGPVVSKAPNATNALQEILAS